MRPTPPSLNERTRRSTDALALIAFCGFLFLLGLQLVGLIGADEPRYAQVAREMLARHDWVTPVLYGHPWLEKPPLYYWSAMVAYKAAGQVTDTAARLPSAVLSSLLIVFIFVWTRRFRRGMQLDAALITAACALIIGFGRSASTDMPLAVMFTAAMLCWYGWYSSNHRGWLLGFYFFSGLGTLAKGPVAVFLAGLIIVTFAVLRRDGRLLLRTLWPIGIALYLAITVPWFIAVQRANPDFFRVFFLQHNLERFTTNLYHHPEPFWFYLPVALLALVPWTVFVVAAVVDAIRDWRFSVQQPAGQEDFRTYLTLWLLLPIVFFSLSQSKLPGYILPAIPAGAILLANFIRRREEEAAKPSLWMVLLHALLCAAIPVAALIAPFKLLHLPLGRNVIIVAAALAIITILMLWLTLENQGYRVLRFVTLVPVVIAFALLLRGTAPIINLLQSERPVELILSQTEIGRLPDMAVYDVSPAVEYGLGFYRNHPIASYERNEIPSGDHIVVAAAGTGAELVYRLPGRRVTRFGGFQLQHLDFYLITGAPTGRQHP
ncbi:MAG: glycosyltransferase family 39 protein [Candidatus Korobacteraceae bacterium]